MKKIKEYFTCASQSKHTLRNNAKTLVTRLVLDVLSCRKTSTPPEERNNAGSYRYSLVYSLLANSAAICTYYVSYRFTQNNMAVAA